MLVYCLMKFSLCSSFDLCDIKFAVDSDLPLEKIDDGDETWTLLIKVIK